MSFWDKIFGGSGSGSGQRAKERIQIILRHDRTDISPQWR